MQQGNQTRSPRTSRDVGGQLVVVGQLPPGAGPAGMRHLEMRVAHAPRGPARSARRCRRAGTPLCGSR
jgi:hypothetical protein